MKGRATRALAMLFGLSLVLTACNVNSVRELLADVFPAPETTTDFTPAPAAGAADTVSEAAEEPSEDADEADEASEDEQPSFDSADHPANLRDEIAPRHRARKRTAQRPDRERADDEPGERADDESEESPEPTPERRRETPQPAEREEPAGGGGQSGDLSAIEQQVFDLLNAERQRAGLSPLQLDSTLTQGARAWSRRMATEGFFSHDTSGNFAENIAYGYPSPEAVHRGWMESEGHRNNRMNSRYTSYGIGAFEQGGTIYWTERFN